MSKLKPSKVILEITSIVFAVLLALGLDAWQERRKDHQAVQAITEDIITEVRQNLRAAQTIFAANTLTADSLRHKIAAYESGASRDLSSTLLVTDASDIAWRTANTSQVARLLDRDLLFAFERTYKEQALYDALVQNYRAFQVSMDPDMDQLKRVKYRLTYLRRMNARVEELIQAYETLLGEDGVENET